MIYATSDPHGCYEKYVALLEKIEFTEKDTLYVLGDVVDRGEGGIAIVRDMLTRENVVPLLGNHDFTARTLLTRLREDKTAALRDDAFVSAFREWLAYGGRPTAKAFFALPDEEQAKILYYLSTFGLYEELEVAGKRFFLSHTIPAKGKPAGERKLFDYILGEPDYDQVYDPDVYYVTGHTPTFLIGFCGPKIFNRNNHIAIDCGAVFGGRLACVRLDDLAEYYVE